MTPEIININNVAIEQHSNAKRFSYAIRVAACVDYLIDVPTADIEFKYGVRATLVTYWIRKRGCFKLRADK